MWRHADKEVTVMGNNNVVSCHVGLEISTLRKTEVNKFIRRIFMDPKERR